MSLGSVRVHLHSCEGIGGVDQDPAAAAPQGKSNKDRWIRKDSERLVQFARPISRLSNIHMPYQKLLS